MSTEISIKSAESSFLALKAECDALSTSCGKLTIKDELSLKMATKQYSLLKAKMKEVEDSRVEIKSPFLKAGQQIDALAKKLYDPMEKVLDEGREKVVAYNNEQKEKALAETKRINDIKSKISKYSADAIAAFDACKTEAELSFQRDIWIMNFFPDEEAFGEFFAEADALKFTLNDFCKNKRIAINTPAESDPETEIIIKEAIEEVVSEVGAVEIEKAVYVAPKNISGKFVAEVVNLSLVPREYLMFDESAIKKFIKENSDKLSDGMIEGGIKFVWVENVKIR